MRYFNKILYVSLRAADETEGLKQALSLARNNDAPLKVLIVCPDFSGEIADYKEKLEGTLVGEVEATLSATMKSLGIGDGEVKVEIDLVSDNKPSVRIVQEVLRHEYDLLVKEAEAREPGRGFKAIDMALLRKCPCPVWLSRPIERSRNDIRVAVAIDPESVQEAAHALSIRMLQLAQSLADSCSGTLNIVSCWDHEHENFLRYNPWAILEESKVDDVVATARERHRKLLEELVAEADLDGEQKINHLRGRAEEIIPSWVADEAIDILVMGTVARVGISGFAIGNTAENILQELTSSLVALKPIGFVSPVKAYD